MSSQPPPPKPPQRPQKPQPFQQPQQQPQQYMPEEKPSSNAGMIIAIIVGVVLVVVVLPVAICGGLFFMGVSRAKQAAEEFEQQIAQEQRAEEEARAALEAQLLRRLDNKEDGVLYLKAKEAIPKHFPDPEGARNRVYNDWVAKRLSDNQFEIHGTITYAIRGGGNKSFPWSCEFTTFDDPADRNAEWQLDRLVVDGMQHFP